jgi:hypothetical protein
MGIMAWLRRQATGRTTHETLASRHERREAGRQRHHDTGAPAWTDDDRHPEGSGERLVADVAPGTPGHHSSVRLTRLD